MKLRFLYESLIEIRNFCCKNLLKMAQKIPKAFPFCIGIVKNLEKRIKRACKLHNPEYELTNVLF